MSRTMSPTAAFGGVAAVFAAFFLAAGAPTPLLALRQQQWGFSADTLTLAKLDHDAEPAEPADLGALLRDRVEGLADPGKAVLSLPAKPVMAPVRRTALSRAVDNLVSNALKYGGAAEITLRRDGGVAEMLFEDRGPGIPAAERQAVLEPFYRRDGARTEVPVRCRLDTAEEEAIYQAGGVLRRFAQDFLAAAAPRDLEVTS